MNVSTGVPFKRNASVYNSTLYFVNALRDALIANGINVRGLAMDIDDVVDAPRGDAGVTLVSYRSPPLSILAATMMKLSQNLYAETLMQAIGGPDQARSVLEGWSITPQSVLIADGSGLSRYNLVTADMMASVVRVKFFLEEP